MKAIYWIAVMLSLGVAVPFHAAATSHDAGATKGKTAASAAAMTRGEVRKVDKAAARITLKHGEIRALDMPAMTMVFRVKDPAMLEGLKAGDMVDFRAEKAGSSFVVTELIAAK